MSSDPRPALPTAVALLGIQAEDTLDDRGRVRGLCGIAIDCTPQQRLLWIGDGVPDGAAAELSSLFQRAAPVDDPASPPPLLASCRHILERSGLAPRCSAGPTFVFPDEVAAGSNAQLERSDGGNVARLRQANPGNWHPVEWDELLDGCLGPWAMALERGRIVSICHTPVPVRTRAVECGVWTDPDFRGRGHGAAVTAEWAALMRSPGRHLFYNTGAENHSSQRLAGRLGLRLLAWTWQLAIPAVDQHDRLHPLCSLRRGR